MSSAATESIQKGCVRLRFSWLLSIRTFPQLFLALTPARVASPTKKRQQAGDEIRDVVFVDYAISEHWRS